MRRVRRTTIGGGEDGSPYTRTDKDVETKFDSYGRVELSDVTLDGEDVTARSRG